MSVENSLASLLLATVQLTKEANSPRGETKKTNALYDKHLKDVCKELDVDPKVVDDLAFPKG